MKAEKVVAANLDKSFCTYLLTIRRINFDQIEAKDFRLYFDQLISAGCQVLVIDGSPVEVYKAYDKAWLGSCFHAPVDPQYKYLNGKVNGVHTGVALAAHNRIILADDDIRYTSANIYRMAELLKVYEMVRPQNYLQPLPFWARTEAARMLINRAWIAAGDYSGTLGIQRSAMQRVGHYDGDVLFDNEEIVRHFRLHRANIKYARDFFILKRPPTFQKWIEQRPRQAYEDFVMRSKTLFFLLLPWVFVFAWLFGGWLAMLICADVVATGTMLIATRGLGDKAINFFPPWIILYAPLWIAERTVSTYWAIYWRIRHGGYPFGDKILSKGTGRAWTTN